MKEYDLETAAGAIVPLLHEETVLLPILNGVDIAERLRSILPRGRVLGGCVYISAFIEAPGVVRQVGGTCQLFFPDQGKAEGYGPLETLLKGAGIKAELTAEIAVHLWSKYLFVSPMAGVTSRTGQELRRNHGGREGAGQGPGADGRDRASGPGQGRGPSS